MQFDHRTLRLGAPSRGRGWFGRVLASVGGALLLVGAFMFSLVAFAVLAGVGLVAGAWLWWKTRALRRRMREMQEMAASAQNANARGEFHRAAEPARESGGNVIEGVVIESRVERD